ncbi:hypothetical protein [Absidia glauca]|uniref:Uncharacterized protein n=1 Tax=Absidia glauca TaxID=4829 RepID=A0A163JTD8_ABSGL|nr:hypothetical protein [Absidia glauca]
MKESTTALKRTPIKGDIHKRVPQRPAAALTDIYVSQKSKIPVIVKRIRQLMMSERHESVSVHGMGAMVLRAITIAQRTQAALENQVTLSMTTHTVTLVDDIIPHDMDEDIQSQQRQCSAIRIDLGAKPGLAELQKKVTRTATHPSRNRKLRR